MGCNVYYCQLHLADRCSAEVLQLNNILSVVLYTVKNILPFAREMSTQSKYISSVVVGMYKVSDYISPVVHCKCFSRKIYRFQSRFSISCSPVVDMTSDSPTQLRDVIWIKYISTTTEEMQSDSLYIYATTEEMYFTYVNLPSPNGKIFFTVYSTTDEMYSNRSTSALRLIDVEEMQ